ncbi:MAG: hypothetical protein BGP04_05230 [Rhizobiales bacterium 62-17]|nr:2OG-Fe(II) oxygenase [Hyphomicrobiales bacterium]OJY02727.1 MAG: hypothetical protein BGP04_05230 [Rhizobiales bacterium 62-17]
MTAASPASADQIVKTFCASVDAARPFDAPYRHFLMDELFPAGVSEALNTLPFKAPSVEGVSGKRELHNDTRSYFDDANMARFPVMKEVAKALHGPDVTRAIAQKFGAPIDDTLLRLEYALDIDGFWLQPHTDLGVKKFTCLIYLSHEEGHEDLGTDIYVDEKTHHSRSPFIPNTAMVFVPGDNTYHGFVRRPIHGVRKSVILNYVTHDWRAREQLSFADQPIRL